MSTTALSSAENARSPGSNAAVSPGSKSVSLREGALRSDRKSTRELSPQSELRSDRKSTRELSPQSELKSDRKSMREISQSELKSDRKSTRELSPQSELKSDRKSMSGVSPQSELKSDRKSVRDSEMRSAGKSGRSVEARYGMRDDGDGEWSELGSEVTSELRSKAKSGRRSERRQGGADEFELSESDVDAHGENFFDSSRRSDRQPSSGAPEEEEETEEQIIIRLQKELREFEAYEEEMQPNLNMYEEVIELRREAEQLEDDRKRALLQIDLGDISSYYDGDVEREVEELEAAVENSYLQACWTKERQRYIARNETDLPEWWRVDIMKLGFRLREAKRSFDSSNRVAQDLYRAHEVKVNATTDSRDKAKAELRQEIAAELNELRQRRERLLVIDKEQRFHLRRGTHVKELQVTSKRRQDALEARVVGEENRHFGAAVELKRTVKDLEMELIQLRRELKDAKVSGESIVQELRKHLLDVTRSGEEVRKARQDYEEENSDLMSLKHELQCVLHYIRVRAREANY